MGIFGEFLDLRVNLWRAISRDCGRVRRSRFDEEIAEELRLKVGAAPIVEGDERSSGVNLFLLSPEIF